METIVERSVDEKIVKAWKECIRSQTFGVLSYETDNEDGSFSVLFRYSPNAVGDMPPTVTDFRTIAATCQNPPAVGSELPYGGLISLFTRGEDRDGNYPTATYAMNTTKGATTGTIPPIIKQTPPKQPVIRAIRVFSALGTTAAHPTAEVSVPQGYKMIGGGAKVNWSGAGSLLTASYPKAFNIWVASSKDHSIPSPATIEVWAIAIEDPKDDFEVVIDSSDSPRMPHPEVLVNARSGYQLVGGGAQAHGRPPAAGQLLTASHPIGTNTWHAKSKDHVHPDPSVLTAYAISMRPRNGTDLIPIQINSRTGSTTAHPKGECEAPAGCKLIGGGALVNWAGAGSLLTASHPRGNEWVTASKDHQVPDPSSITTFTMGIDLRHFA
jgi:hypothetical protein